jgi:hypothetical protein
MALLHRKAVAKGELDDFWEKTTALGSSSIGKALFQESVLRLLRREIRRDTGILIDSEDLAQAVNNMLSTEAREQIGPVRVRRRRKTTRPKAPAAAPPPPPTPTPSPTPGDSGT